MSNELLSTPAPPERISFSVRCISCGEHMRDDRNEDSFGQCWKCFYRILNDHLRAQKPRTNPFFASDR